jgi:Asp/Glu/hydantoin racemase
MSIERREGHKKVHPKEGTSKMRGSFKIPRSGLPYFGQAVGVLMEDPKGTEGRLTRIPGDVGNGSTFDFPVQYKVMWGVYNWDIVNKKPTKETEKKVIKYAKELEMEGVRAIGTYCGFMSYFQPVLAAAVEIPVFSSSLLQVPLVSRLIGRDRKVGIITFDSRELSKEHLIRAGIDDSIPITIYGLDMLPSDRSWYDIRELKPDKRLKLSEDRLIFSANQLISMNEDIGAIVFECTNLPPGAAAVQKATGLPVFDVTTLLNWAYNAVVRRRFVGFV